MKKLFLCILDGFGIGDKNYKYNAIFQAKTPNFQRFLNVYSNCKLKTSGLSVGLPEGQMGNSEVGHMTIGSGRVLMQDLPRINKEIETGNLWNNKEIKSSIESLKETGGRFHILGLCSDGGVHSHINHIISVANFFANSKIEVYIHAISDGRDVPTDSFLKNIESVKKSLNPLVKIVTLCGRFYTMDRDKKFERTEQGINLILKGEGKNFNNIEEAIIESYENGKTDEFIEPCKFENYQGASVNDILFFANFRADRGRQGLELLLEACLFKKIITMMPYSDELAKKASALLYKEEITETMPEIISKNGLKQFRIAETEKYAHVTFFFNGGKEELLKGEERVIIPSPKVATYDLKPEMSLPLVEEKLLEIISQNKFEMITCNIANGDMVGHTGNFEAAKKAAERIDEFLGKMEKICLHNNYYFVITADHGNLEEMLDENGKVHTQHTTGEVPFIIISNERFNLQNGSLANIASTCLNLLKLQPSDKMEASLIK